MSDAGRMRLKKAARNQARLDEEIDKINWQRWARCPFCGLKICVNNYADRKVRVPKLDGVPMCPACQARGGKFMAAAYLLLRDLVQADGEFNAYDDAHRAIMKMAIIPKWMANEIEPEDE